MPKKLCASRVKILYFLAYSESIPKRLRWVKSNVFGKFFRQNAFKQNGVVKDVYPRRAGQFPMWITGCFCDAADSFSGPPEVVLTIITPA